MGDEGRRRYLKADVYKEINNVDYSCTIHIGAPKTTAPVGNAVLLETGLVSKSPTHTGMIFVKTPKSNISNSGPFNIGRL